MQTQMPRFVRILVGMFCATILCSIGFLTSTPNEFHQSDLIPDDVTLTNVSHTSEPTIDAAETLEPATEPEGKRRFTMPVRRRSGSARVATESTVLQAGVNTEELDSQTDLPTATASEGTLPKQVDFPVDTSADDLDTSSADQTEASVSADLERVDTQPIRDLEAEKPAVAEHESTRTELTKKLDIRKEVADTRVQIRKVQTEQVTGLVQSRVTVESKRASTKSVSHQAAETSPPTPPSENTSSKSQKDASFLLHIENPKELGVPLEFTYRRKAHRLQPGDTFETELGASGKAIVRFDRGKNGIRTVRTLRFGHYAFRATKRGWSLVRIDERK